MADERVQRKLAAILAADVVGYSRLMEADETGTRVRFNDQLDAVVRPAIAARRGRLVKTMGDGFLVAFDSVVDAVQCAADIQAGVTGREANAPEDRRMPLRVGIHLGDVIVEGEDIHGDGVNIAARLEGLAEPGGICVSDMVHAGVRNKLALDFVDLGPQSLKNIAEPVRVFAVRPAAAGSAPAALPLPDKPSIAVLPFANMSGDPEQDYFADGTAEDIITALSRFRQFFVIARNSSFAYKGREVDVRRVGRELGVRYVLEGSVRKADSRLRITAQLVEAETGNHLWAERYDGALGDVFDLQDRITEQVAGAIEPNIQRAEIERARRKRPDSLDAYDLYLRALRLATNFSRADSAAAVDLLERAIRIDPHFAAAHGLAAFCLGQRPMWGETDPGTRQSAIEHARAVLAMDTDDAFALATAGLELALFAREYDAGRRAVDQALALNPNSAWALSISAVVHSQLGNIDPAIEHAERSMRLNPFDPMRVQPLIAMGRSHFLAGRFEEAAECALHAIQANPRFLPAYIVAIAACVRAGRRAEADGLVERLKTLEPDLRWSVFVETMLIDPDHQAKLAAPLRETSLPE